jgi:F-type H+-transporting ATPase subunit delta
MQAASRESYAAASQRLESLVAQSSPEQLSELADELLAVAELLTREPRLRRTLADPARTGSERAALLTGLLDGRVSATARELSGVLVAGRWSRASELLDGAERLGVEALLASAQRAGDLDDVEDELFRFGQVVDANPELATVLGDPTAQVAQRATLVRSLLEGRATPVTTRLGVIALQGYGGRGLQASLTRLVEAAAERRNRQVAYVTTARTLSEAEERRLGDRLAEMYGRQVAIKISVDPKIIGGLSVRIGHDLYDGTILRRLTETRAALAGRA